MNQEQLKSNAELNAALRSSEVEEVAQADMIREVAAENRKDQDALCQQDSKMLALDTTLGNLEVQLTEAAGSTLTSCQLSASEEQCAELKEAIDMLRTELEASRSFCRELKQQLCQEAGCEDEAQLTRLLEVQNELNSAMCRADQFQARAQEFEASKQQPDTLCSELRRN